MPLLDISGNPVFRGIAWFLPDNGLFEYIYSNDWSRDRFEFG